MSVRQPAVAGLFYPGGAAGLRRTVKSLLDEARLHHQPPERAPKDAAAARGGWIALPAPAAGAYQVSIDGPHWVDAIQGGKALQSAAHGSDPTCTLFHKSVRFELTNEPLILQFSGEDTDRVAFTIMPAE